MILLDLSLLGRCISKLFCNNINIVQRYFVLIKNMEISNKIRNHIYKKITIYDINLMQYQSYTKWVKHALLYLVVDKTFSTLLQLQARAFMFQIPSYNTVMIDTTPSTRTLTSFPLTRVSVHSFFNVIQHYAQFGFDSRYGMIFLLFKGDSAFTYMIKYLCGVNL